MEGHGHFPGARARTSLNTLFAIFCAAIVLVLAYLNFGCKQGSFPFLPYVR